MKENTKKAGLAGAAIVATAAAAAAAYLYLGENAPERRRKLAAWMREAEKEIKREILRLKDATLSDERFQDIVEAVADRYRAAQNLSPDDVAAFISMVTSNWREAKRAAARSPRSISSRKRAGTRGRRKSDTSSS